MSDDRQAYPITDIVIVAGTCMVLCFKLAEGARHMMRRGVPRVRDFLANKQNCFCRVAQVADACEEHTMRLMESKIKGNLTTAIWALLLACAATMGLVNYNILFHNARWMSDGQTFVVLFVLAFLAVGAAYFPDVLTTRPRCLYTGFMIVLCAFEAQPQLLGGFFTETGTFLCRFAVSTSYHRVCEVTCWNILFLISSAYSFASAFDGQDELRVLITYQVWNASVVILLSVFSAKLVEAHVRADVAAAALRDQSSGLSGLLDLVCDVVVTLGEDLRIKGQSSRFSAMVMLQGRSDEGIRLQDYMPSAEDQDAFERCARGDSAAPRALHVKFRDGWGNSINVELFCAHVETIAGRTHFVGIREFSDFTGAAAAALQSPARSPRRRSRREHRANLGPRGSGESSSSDSRAPAMAEGCPDVFEVDEGREDAACTPEEAMQLALLRVMQLCRMEARAECCCPFHLRVSRLRRSLKHLDKMPCVASFGETEAARQCAICGLLADNTASPCFACEAAAPDGVEETPSVMETL